MAIISFGTFRVNATPLAYFKSLFKYVYEGQIDRNDNNMLFVLRKLLSLCFVCLEQQATRKSRSHRPGKHASGVKAHWQRRGAKSHRSPFTLSPPHSVTNTVSKVIIILINDRKRATITHLHVTTLILITLNDDNKHQCNYYCCNLFTIDAAKIEAVDEIDRLGI